MGTFFRLRHDVAENPGSAMAAYEGVSKSIVAIAFHDALDEETPPEPRPVEHTKALDGQRMLHRPKLNLTRSNSCNQRPATLGLAAG